MSEQKPLVIHHKQFEYSPFMTGTYLGLACCVPVTFILGIKLFVAHLLLLLFLVFGLRPLLEKTGLYRLLSHSLVIVHDKANQKFEKDLSAKIDRKVRDDKCRGRRKKHPDLPKNW